MANGWLLYSAFIQSTVQSFTHSHTHTHTHTHTSGDWLPCKEQLGVRCLSQGHFDTARVESNWQPSDCQMTALTSWASSYSTSCQCKSTTHQSHISHQPAYIYGLWLIYLLIYCAVSSGNLLQGVDHRASPLWLGNYAPSKTLPAPLLRRVTY